MAFFLALPLPGDQCRHLRWLEILRLYPAKMMGALKYTHSMYISHTVAQRHMKLAEVRIGSRRDGVSRGETRDILFLRGFRGNWRVRREQTTLKTRFLGHAHTGYNRYVCRLGIVENNMLWTCQLSSMSMLQYLTLETPLRLWMRAASARLGLWAMGRAPLFSFFPLPPGTFPLVRVLLALLFGFFFSSGSLMPQIRRLLIHRLEKPRLSI